jgi:hypothetical protein
MFAGPEEVAMHRQLERDPTEFFSVVGAPYVRERAREDRVEDDCVYSLPAFMPSRRRSKIGFAAVCAALGTVLLGMSLFASDSAARLAEVAFQAIAMK